MRKGPLLIGLVVFSAVAGGSFAYGWYSMTNMSTGQLQPDDAVAMAAPESGDLANPQRSPSKGGATSPDSLSAGPGITQQLDTLTREHGQVTVTLDATQVNQLVSEAILSQPQAASIFEHAQSLTTRLDRDRIETGAVLNLSEIPLEALPTELQTGLTQLTHTVPILAERDIYVGIVARPQVQDGQITLDQELNLKLGQFTLPLADVAETMGLSTSDIEQRLNTQLNQQGLTLDAIEILEENLVITGSRP